MNNNPIAILGDFLHFPTTDANPHGRPLTPIETGQANHQETPYPALLVESGLLLIEDGHISALGDAQVLQSRLPSDCRIIDHGSKLIIPGLIDSHVHYPQTEMIASHGSQLLDWLNRYTFPVESQYADKSHASKQASFFLDELLRNGTTTALVFGTVHSESVDAFFEQALKRNLRMICGKVMMDRNAPVDLCDTADQSYADSKSLIKRWHGLGRLGYAVTPRFAPTSTPEQLEYAGQLLAEHPDVNLHTHLSENVDECKWVQELYPEHKHYLDVYDHYKLLGPRSVFAHCIHLHETEWQRLAETGSGIAHCPLSNLFIGSGLFQLQAAAGHGVNVGLGTDVGGGDSLSILRAINEAYKVQQLQGHSLSPLKALYLATLGGAETLALDRQIGNFDIGKEADFIVLDEQSTPLLAMRSAACTSVLERLFSVMMLGDDRAVSHTYIQGREMKNSLPG